MGFEQDMSHNEFSKGKEVKKLTSYMMHKHYCENDVESLICLFDEKFFWFGTGEAEFAVGTEKVSKIFRQFTGLIPKCNITEEEYEVMEIVPDVYLCVGRVWIVTDPSTNIYLRVHQRITTVFRWIGDHARCCHIHISNPYEDMAEEDIGFPTKIGHQSYLYLQECVAEQKKKIEEQNVLLKKLSFEDSQTGLFNRNKFNDTIDNFDNNNITSLGIAMFDLNGLKKINDSRGHAVGDNYIVLAAKCISKFFYNNVFRIGGDEFAVIFKNVDEKTFSSLAHSVCEDMENNGVSSSVGLSWRNFNLNINEQLTEADEQMYQRKSEFYQLKKNDRRI